MELTPLQQMRLLIQDPEGASQQFTDDELNFFVSAGGNVYKGAAMALRTWATKLAREEEMVKLGQWQGDKRDVAGKLLALATELDKKGAATGTMIYHARMDWTPHEQARREIAEEEASD